VVVLSWYAVVAQEMESLGPNDGDKNTVPVCQVSGMLYRYSAKMTYTVGLVKRSIAQLGAGIARTALASWDAEVDLAGYRSCQ
jgi:hypothetical protein